MTTEAAISIQQLSKSYQESGRQHDIFSELNLQVRRGEFIVLLGRSGSGKSTFLNLVSGIDPPDSGKVIINGINITGLSEHDRTLFRRHHIGFVFQSMSRSALGNIHTAISVWADFRGCNYLFIFRPVDLLATQIAPTAVSLVHRAAVAFTSLHISVCYLAEQGIC